MHINVGRLTGASLWLAATGLIVLCEVQMMCHRTWPVPVAASSPPQSTRQCDPAIGRTARSGEGLRLGDAGQQHSSAILVVGSAGTALDGEFEVTLTLERADAHQQFGGDAPDIAVARVSAPNHGDSRQDRVSSANRLASQPVVPVNPVARPGIPQFDVTRRVFFTHSRRGSLADPASYSAIHCRLVGESDSIRVFADQTVIAGEPLDSLTAELTHLADEIISPAVQALVGPVRDVDGDGRLAVVLTSQLGQADGALANVDGLTRASDFRHEVPRPVGNEADVIFLNANLPPGERLRAVFAHEWAHAAIFGRRYGGDSEQVPTEDDWLNEALAHLIEVRASGSSSNVAHRIQNFLDRPEAAPLVVRDYYRPEYWRHHGCRGAAFLFLDWCLNQSGPQCFDRLIDGHFVGVEHLERATDRSFDQLFRGWTTSLGKSLAASEIAGEETVPGAEALRQQGLSNRPRPHEWRPRQHESQRMTLRLKGTTAAYVKIILDEAAANWRLVADAPPECRLQLTVIPIERAR